METIYDFPQCKDCTFRQDSVFKNLPAVDIEQIDMNKGCQYYQKGQSVFVEGTRPTGLYCIYGGKIKVFKRGDEGKEHIVRLAKEGDILGYRSLIGNELYAASAESLESSSVCFIPRNVFFKLLKTNSDFALVMMQKLCFDLGKAEHSITGLAQKPVKERLAESLLKLLDTYGLKDDGVSLNINLTRKDLADITGTATETAIRLLSGFKKEGLVALHGREIKILDHTRLIRKANLFE